MIQAGILLAVLSGIASGVLTAPMKLVRAWKWENIWLVFIVGSCLAFPLAVVGLTVPDAAALYRSAPRFQGNARPLGVPGAGAVALEKLR